EFKEFYVGEIVEADGRTRHSDFIVYQYYARQYDRVVHTINLNVMNSASTFGQATNGENGCSFGATPKEAPIFHLNGHPTMRVHSVWVKYPGGKKLYEYSDELKELVDAFPSDEGAANKVGHRIKEVPYKLKEGEKVGFLHVQVGTPGLGKGTFAAIATENGF